MRISGEGSSGRGKGQCKGPEAGTHAVKPVFLGQRCRARSQKGDGGALWALRITVGVRN